MKALIYAAGFLLLFGWIALGVQNFDGYFGVTLPLWTDLIGVVVMLIGVSLVLTCVGVFVARGRGTTAVFDPPKEFVGTGPYKYVRNPMYIGGCILLVGFGLYHRSVSIVAMSLILFLLLHLFVLFFEEPELEKRFGESYLDYKTSVKRWIPKWK